MSEPKRESKGHPRVVAATMAACVALADSPLLKDPTFVSYLRQGLILVGVPA